MRAQSLSLLFSGCVFFAACSAPSEPASDPSPLETPVESSANAAEFAGDGNVEGPALWRVADEDTTVFMFGTVHVLKPDLDWLSDEVREIVRGADAVYFEADVDSRTAQTSLVRAVTELGLYTDGSTLSQRLNSDQQREVQEALELFGIPAAGIDNMQPWLASIQLADLHLNQQGYDQDSGVESVLTEEANRGNVPLRYLETGVEQIELLASISEATQIEMLVETARQIEDEPNILDDMIDEWVEGDVAALAELVAEDETFISEDATAIMLTGRNANWARQIDALLAAESGQFVVAVGAAHLVGEGSLQDQLQDFGHTTDRL
ncbi:MAG: TraB/GumN family protein [Pseudomonadota bacterium]